MTETVVGGKEHSDEARCRYRRPQSSKKAACDDLDAVGSGLMMQFYRPFPHPRLAIGQAALQIGGLA